MKKLYILLIFCSLCFFLNAQECNLRLDSTTCYEDNIPKTISRHLYNEMDSVISHTIYFYEEASKSWSNKPRAESTYEYDKNGNKTKEVSISYSEDQSYAIKDSSTFDEKNRRTELYFIRWNDSLSVWIPNSKHKFIYSENGKLSTSTTFRWNSEWYKDYTSEYKYDTLGNLIKKTTYNYIGENRKILHSDEFKYDENNLLKSRVSGYFDPHYEEVIYDRKWEYTYNEKGEEIEALNFIYDSKFDYLFSEKRYLFSDKWIKDSQDLYEYNDKGAKIKILTHSFNKEGDIKETKTIEYNYTYNSCGLPESYTIPGTGSEKDKHYKYYYSQKQNVNQ